MGIVSAVDDCLGSDDPTVIAFASIMRAHRCTVGHAEDVLIAAGVPVDQAERASDAVASAIVAEVSDSSPDLGRMAMRARRDDPRAFGSRLTDH